ncbi:putative transporter SVOPL, partial [Ophiophagus hannah]
VFWLSGSLLIIGLASVVNSTLGWRWLIRIASIPGILLLLVFKFIPESARYNVSSGNDKAALATLKWIAKMNRSVIPEGKLGISFAYYGVILASAELLEKDLVCSRGGGGSAVEAELGHTQEEFQSPCLCHTFAPSDYQIMFISTVGEIALNPLNILGINFLGRRVSLTVTMGCTAVFFLLLNICTTITGLIGFLFMLRAFVAANFNTIYIYTAEVYPTTMRAMGLGTSGSLCRIGAMVAPFIAQVLMNASFMGALCLFALVCIVCAISAFTLPIETKGRSLQVGSNGKT